MTRAIGIDLRTSRSCMACISHDKAKPIFNNYEEYTYYTPSIVEFTNMRRFVGKYAGNGSLNSENTVYGVKRLLGRNFADPETQTDIRNFPFKVIDRNGKPGIQIDYKSEKRIFTPEEISCMILARLKDKTEEHLGTEIKDVVISVPTCFNESQRQATRDAGRIAGLNVLGIINEPTAAAIAYRDAFGPQTGSFLFFDLGGGTLSVSLIYMDNDLIQVKASGGSTHLGGQDFTSRLADFLAQEFQLKTKKDISGNRSTFRLLWHLAEEVKRVLSRSTEVPEMLPWFLQGLDFDTSITRAQFEELCEDLFSKAINIVKEVLKEANIDKGEVDEVVLVGTSTNIPKVQEMLSELFGENKLVHCMVFRNAVADGAAIQAAILAGDSSPQEQELSLKDITPLSLGLKVEDDLMWNVKPRTSRIQIPLPEICTTEDYQTEIVVQVMHGDGRLNKEKTLFETFKLTGITCAGALNAQVTFDIDANGILTVSAVEKGTNNTQDIAITNDTRNLSPEEIERMIKDAEKLEQNEKEAVVRLNAAYTLGSNVTTPKSKISEKKRKASPATVSKLETPVDKTRKWLWADEDPCIEETEAIRRLEALFDTIIADSQREKHYYGSIDGAGEHLD